MEELLRAVKSYDESDVGAITVLASSVTLETYSEL